MIGVRNVFREREDYRRKAWCLRAGKGYRRGWDLRIIWRGTMPSGKSESFEVQGPEHRGRRWRIKDEKQKTL